MPVTMRNANPPMRSAMSNGGASVDARADAIMMAAPITMARPDPHRNTE